MDDASGATVIDCAATLPEEHARSVVSRCDEQVVVVDERAPIAAVAKVLLKSTVVSGRDVAVVIGADGAPVGVLRRSACLPSRQGRGVVRDAMEPIPLLLDARDGLEHAAFELGRARVELAVVIGWGGGVIGVVRAADLQRDEAQAYAPPSLGA